MQSEAARGEAERAAFADRRPQEEQVRGGAGGTQRRQAGRQAVEEGIPVQEERGEQRHQKEGQPQPEVRVVKKKESKIGNCPIFFYCRII